ncbi:MAG TPA: N-acetylmuramoyl-L-alanine amidase, partial [Flavobacterium sp.]|nr:N-acetylmuramoyl-L-alanine amidase [Flavobacterium sp.]
MSLAFVKKDDKQIHVVIDAGHGGIDRGALHEEVAEKDIVDAITTKIKLQNKDADVVLHFTRIGDEFVALSDRTAKINEIKPDLVLSL